MFRKLLSAVRQELRNFGLRGGRHRRSLVDVAFYPFDVVTALRAYRAKRGVFPRVLSPQLFTEWLQRRKLIGRKYAWSQFADKLRVRTFVAEQIGESYLNKVL